MFAVFPPKSVDQAVTSHPIPARGETTPDTRPVRDGLDDSPILPFPPGFDPATRLPVEPAGTPLSAQDLAWMDEWAAKCRTPYSEMTPDEARRVTAFAAMWFVPALTEVHRLTSEVSALREAVDADKARLDWLDARDSFDFEDFVTAWHQGVSVREAIDIARRDGAP